MTSQRLVRTKNDRMLFGLAGGLARYLNIDPFLVRAGFVILTVTTGFGLPLYLLMALITPSSKNRHLDGAPMIRDNFDDFLDGDLGELMGENDKTRKRSIGWGLLLFGGFMVISQADINFSAIFPWLLIGLGCYFLWDRLG